MSSKSVLSWMSYLDHRQTDRQTYIHTYIHSHNRLDRRTYPSVENHEAAASSLQHLLLYNSHYCCYCCWRSIAVGRKRTCTAINQDSFAVGCRGIRHATLMLLQGRTEVPPATQFAERIPHLFFVTLTNQANAARTKCLSGNLTVDIGYRGYWYLSQPTQKYTYKPPKYELELLAMPHSNLVKNQPISITFVFSTFWENFTPENNNNAHLPCVLLPTCHDTLGDSNLIFRQ